MRANSDHEEEKSANEQVKAINDAELERVCKLLSDVFGERVTDVFWTEDTLPRPLPASMAPSEDDEDEDEYSALERKIWEIGAERVAATAGAEHAEMWEEILDEYHDGDRSWPKARSAAALFLLPHGLGPWLAAGDDNLWFIYERVLGFVSSGIWFVREKFEMDDLLPGFHGTITEEDRLRLARWDLSEAYRLGSDVAMSLGNHEQWQEYLARSGTLSHEAVTPLKLLFWAGELERMCASVEEALEEEAQAIEEQAKAELLTGGDAA